MLPVYILIRTSRRPEFFRRMMDTVRGQSYKSIVSVVYTDDPRDDYVTGDIIIQGPIHDYTLGDATYNLYCNDLLKQVPSDDGWVYFLDDDDELYDEFAIEKMVNASLKDYVNVFKVVRNRGKIVPERWENQRSFQTECFMIHASHRNKAKWWPHKGGDHNYSKQLTKIMPIKWNDFLVCKIQEGKGYGHKQDKNGKGFHGTGRFTEKSKIAVYCTSTNRFGPEESHMRQGEKKLVLFSTAQNMERHGIGKIIYPHYNIIRS